MVQTATTSMDGEAPCITSKVVPQLQSAVATTLQHPITSNPLSTPLMLPSSRDDHINNDFCHMCGDGGNMYNCHYCVSVPSQYTALVLDADVQFMCASCHCVGGARSGNVSPYLGFHRDGFPVLPEFPTISGDFHLPIRSGISSRRTIIIHIRVHTLPSGGPMIMLEEFLRPYFAHSGELIVRTIAFNLTTCALRKNYEREAGMIAGDTCGHNVLITLTSHSDYDHSDLSIGMSRQKKREIASTVETVLDVLLTPFAKITPGSLFIMFACGAIVNKPPSFNEFCNSITRFHFASAIAFDAVRLHPSTCWPFVVFLAEAVFIEEHDLQVAVPHALGHSNKLGQHSGVYVFTRTADHLDITRYFWAHRDFRPWGSVLPVQCPVCGTPQQWKRKLGNDLSYIFECRYSRCGQDPVSGAVVRRRGCIEIKRPEGVEIILHGKTRYSGWLSVQVSQ